MKKTAGIAAMAARAFDEVEPHFTTVLRQADAGPFATERRGPALDARMLMERGEGDDFDRGGECF